MSIELVFDVCLVVNIFITSLTSYQQDVNWVDSIYMIICNYARGTMIFDIAANIPPLFLDMNSQWFNFKLIRFIHIRSVFGWVADMVRILLNRFSLDKGTVEKTSHIINLIIVIFSAIHIIGCAWIAVGQITQCSWLDQVACQGPGLPVDRSNKYEMYIKSIYWVITTLTTVGYGDYKGYTAPEYVV